MELSIVVVNFNTKDLIRECIDSICKHPPKVSYEIIVVDNGSTDGSDKLLSKDKRIQLIENRENLGFARGNNIGIKSAKGKHILLLNSDTKVTAGAIDSLLKIGKEHPDAGAVVAKLLNPDGSIQPSVFRFPTVLNAIRQYWLGKKGLLDKFAPEVNKTVAIEVAVMAAFLITPRTIKKVGLLNEKYFMFFEDFDYCRRIKGANLRIYYEPNARVYHYHGASGHGLADKENQWRRLNPSSKIYHGFLRHYIFNSILWLSQSYRKIAIILLAFILRVLWLPRNLFFGFEQGRDFLKLTEITTGNLTLTGPGTDIPGIFHGALSYYVPLPFFLMFGGDPLMVQVSFIVINCLAIYLLYQAVKDLFSTRVAVIAAILYSISYSSIIYSRWLSNPTLVPALVIGLLFCLVNSKRNAWFLLPGVILWSVIFHLEIVAAIVLVVPIILFLILEKIKLNWRILLLCLGAGFLTLAPYLIFDLRNNNILLDGVKDYLSRPKSGVFDFQGSLDQFANEITDSLFPANRQVSWVILAGAVSSLFFGKMKGYIAQQQKRNYLILTFLFIAPLAYLIYAMRPQRHFYIMTPIFVSIVLGIFIDELLKIRLTWLALYIFFLIAFMNLKTHFTFVPQSRANFIYHAQRMYLGDQKDLIDRIYIDAQGNDFSYDYYSIPYWKKESWNYLFGWYGRKKYGYLPNENRTDIFYVLIEPDETQPEYQRSWYKELNQNSDLISTYESGKLRAEKREQI